MVSIPNRNNRDTCRKSNCHWTATRMGQLIMSWWKRHQALILKKKILVKAAWRKLSPRIGLWMGVRVAWMPTLLLFASKSDLSHVRKMVVRRNLGARIIWMTILPLFIIRKSLSRAKRRAARWSLHSRENWLDMSMKFTWRRGHFHAKRMAVNWSLDERQSWIDTLTSFTRRRSFSNVAIVQVTLDKGGIC